MNLAHLHIVLNHVPSLGTLAAVGLFMLSVVTKNDGLKKISLVALIAMALLVLPTYMSGNAAQQILLSNPAIPKGTIEEHQNYAIVSLILTTITGTLAWFGLWQFRRFSRPGNWNTAGVLIFSALTAAFILQTASLGGEISHPEIRVAGAAPISEEVGWRQHVGFFSNDHSWVWPASETLHFIGMALLFGVSLMVNLRILGMMKSIPFSAVHRLLPLGVLGFIINVVSGMVFYISNPGLYFLNPGFIAKIALLLPTGAGLIYFTVFDKPWAVGQDKNAPLTAKIVAATTMGLLLGVMYYGRMLPFITS